MPKLNNIIVTVELDDTVLKQQLKTMREIQDIMNSIMYFNIYLTNHKDERDTPKYKNHQIAVNSMMNEYIRIYAEFTRWECERL